MKAKRKHRRKKQRGGALYRRKPRVVDKIAEGASMFLSGPAPMFTTLLGKLASQGLKGITDNVKALQTSSWTKMSRLKRQLPFLQSVLKEANRKKRQELLHHANFRSN